MSGCGRLYDYWLCTNRAWYWSGFLYLTDRFASCFSRCMFCGDWCAAAHSSFAGVGFAKRRFRMLDNMRCTGVGINCRHPTPNNRPYDCRGRHNRCAVVCRCRYGALYLKICFTSIWQYVWVWVYAYFAILYILCAIFTWISSLKHQVRYSVYAYSDEPSSWLPWPLCSVSLRHRGWPLKVYHLMYVVL